MKKHGGDRSQIESRSENKVREGDVGCKMRVNSMEKVDVERENGQRKHSFTTME